MGRLPQRDVDARLKETWMHGDNAQEGEGHMFPGHVLAEKECRCWSRGSAVALSPDARRAWERADSKRLTFGPCIPATRRIADGPTKRPLTISLICAFALDSGRPHDEKGAYAGNLQRCIQACGRAILVVGTGAGASIGVRNSHDTRGTDGYRFCGQNSFERESLACHHLRTFLWASRLCAATMFYRKTARGEHASACGTWHHFRTGTPYQLGHFFVEQTDMKRVRDVGPVN